MKNILKIFTLGILAGLSIGLGSLLFIICKANNLQVLGAFVFSIGLLLVCFFGLYLYTGKIGFIISSENKKKYGLELLVGYLGNIVGAVGFGYIARLIYQGYKNNTVLDTATTVATTRQIALGETGTPVITALLSSVFCGMLVFIAVYAWKKEIPMYLKVIILCFAVFAFVLAGFEHCIANMFYISMANMWSPSTLVNILVVTLGNTLGALVLNTIVKYLTPYFSIKK